MTKFSSEYSIITRYKLWWWHIGIAVFFPIVVFTGGGVVLAGEAEVYLSCLLVCRWWFRTDDVTIVWTGSICVWSPSPRVPAAGKRDHQS